MDKIPGKLAGFSGGAKTKSPSLKKGGLDTATLIIFRFYTDFVKPIWVIMVSYGSNSMVCLP